MHTQKCSSALGDVGNDMTFNAVQLEQRMDLASKDHLLWKEVITAETHLMVIFIQEKV